MRDGIAVVRGKGIPTQTFSSDRFETELDFMNRVIMQYGMAPSIYERNTLTFEFIWDIES